MATSIAADGTRYQATLDGVMVIHPNGTVGFIPQDGEELDGD